MVSRNPKDYRPTTHAKQMRRDRGIDWDAVADTIKNGEVQPDKERNIKRFVKDCGFEYPIGVVANTKNGKIKTIEFRYID